MNPFKYLLILGGALVCSVVSPALSYAGGCGRTYCTPTYTPTVVKEVITPVGVPVYVPVIVPAFTFQYAPPVAAVPIVPAVPAIQPAAVVGGGYSQPPPTGYAQPAGYQQPYQQPQQPQQVPPSALGAAAGKDKIRELAKALLEEMQRQSEAGAAGDDTGPPEVPGLPASRPPQTPAQPNPPLPTNPPVGRSGGGPNPQSPFASRAMAALSRTCASCHTGPASDGDAIIFLQPGVINPNAPWKTMEDQIKKGLMPKRNTAAQPIQDEREAMLAWLRGQ